MKRELLLKQTQTQTQVLVIIAQHIFRNSCSYLTNRYYIKYVRYGDSMVT